MVAALAIIGRIPKLRFYDDDEHFSARRDAGVGGKRSEGRRIFQRQRVFSAVVREAKAQKERAERERKKAELEALLIEGLESGPAVPMDKAWWDTLLRDVDEKLNQRGVEGGLGVSTLEELETTIEAAGLREGAQQRVST